MPINFALEAEQSRQRRQMLTGAKAQHDVTLGREPAPGTAAAALPGTTTTTQQFTPSGTAPALPKLPTLEMPKFDRRAIAAETQLQAGPQVRRLRDVTARSLSGGFENPNVRRMTVRQALQGYGGGLASILQGARRAAVQTQLPEYTAQVGAAQRTFEANVANLQNEYSNLWRQFMTTGTTTTTQQTTPK